MIAPLAIPPINPPSSPSFVYPKGAYETQRYLLHLSMDGMITPQGTISQAALSRINLQNPNYESVGTLFVESRQNIDSQQAAEVAVRKLIF